MVLGINLKRIVYMLLAFYCFSCAAQEPNEVITDSAFILGYQLEIINNNGTCILRHTQKGIINNIPLAPNPPCYFMRRNKAIPQIFKYPDVGIRATLIVIGTLITDEQRSTWKLTPDMICGSKRQGVLFLKNDIIISEQVLSSSVACKDKGSDEKDFWFFAHKRP